VIAFFWIGLIFVVTIAAFATLAIVSAMILPALCILIIKKVFSWIATQKRLFYMRLF
jgi:cytochrome c oxidase subunit IV